MWRRFAPAFYFLFACPVVACVEGTIHAKCQTPRVRFAAAALPPGGVSVGFGALPSSCVDPRWAIALHQVDPGDGLHAGTKHSRVGLDPRHTRETLGVVGLPFCSLCFFASAFRCFLGSLFPCRFVSFRFVSFRFASPRLASLASARSRLESLQVQHSAALAALGRHFMGHM